MLCIGDSVGPDIARGEGLDESSSDDDDDDEGESNQRTGMKQFFYVIVLFAKGHQCCDSLG